SGTGQSRERRRWAGNARYQEPFIERLTHELVAGIGNERRAGVGDERHRGSGAKPGQDARALLGGVGFVMGRPLESYVEMREEFLGGARVLCGDYVRAGEYRQCP